jgi:hypothetical protein
MTKRTRSKTKALDASRSQGLAQDPQPAAAPNGPYITVASNDDDRWGDIEVELFHLRNAAKAVACAGEADDGDIITASGVDITATLRFLSVGLEARIDRLKGLLGLKEVTP